MSSHPLYKRELASSGRRTRSSGVEVLLEGFVHE